MIFTEPLCLGVTSTGARNYVADRVLSLEKPFFNARSGRFSVVEAAIKAGVPRRNVFASDIGLFSSIIGYLADPSKKLDDLGIRILDPALEPKGITDELDFAAHVMLILKLNQMKQTNLRGLYPREELLASWNRGYWVKVALMGSRVPKSKQAALVEAAVIQTEPEFRKTVEAIVPGLHLEDNVHIEFWVPRSLAEVIERCIEKAKLLNETGSRTAAIEAIFAEYDVWHADPEKEREAEQQEVS
jgi:hypothetical protein